MPLQRSATFREFRLRRHSLSFPIPAFLMPVQSDAFTLLQLIFEIKNNNISQARLRYFPVDSSYNNYLYMNSCLNTLYHVMVIVDDNFLNRVRAYDLRLDEGTDVFFGNNTDSIDKRDIIRSWTDFDHRRYEMKRRLPLYIVAVCRMRILVMRRKALYLSLYVLRDIHEVCIRRRICALSNLCDS